MAPRTRFRYLPCHEHDHYDAHRLADKLGLSLVDMLHLLISRNLRALGAEPTDDVRVEDRIPPTSLPQKKT